MKRGLLACALALPLAACTAGPEVVIECTDAPGIHAICGFQNPEDLALLEDGRSVVVSQFGSMEGTKSGSLALFDLQTETLRVVFEGSENGGKPEADWGDPTCPGPPDKRFSPHGIDVSRRADGSWQLLVVNHGGRESVELFELRGSGERRTIEWRGCAIPEFGAYFNDVVALPDGGFLVTHMMDKQSQTFELLRAGLLGRDTGIVYEWQPVKGFRPLAGTAAPFPNGIEVSADGLEIYLNVYMAGEVRRISRESGQLIGVAEVRQPDNITWSQDGRRLLVASHQGGLADQLACRDLEQGACPMAFEIVAVDPQTLETTTVFANEGAPMGAGTVAIDLVDSLLIGSFAGDRVIKVKWTPP